MKLCVCSSSIPEYSLEGTVQLLKELGYSAVEWIIADLPPDKKPANYSYENRFWTFNQSTIYEGNVESEAIRAKRLCDDAGLEMPMLSSYHGVWNTDQIERLMKVAFDIGCKNLRLLSPGFDGTNDYKGLFNEFIEQTKKIVLLGKHYGIRVNFETHMETIIPSASAAYRFASCFDPCDLGIIYDPGNFVFEGYEDYRIGISILNEYISHVHVKNALWKFSASASAEEDKWSADFASLESGYANYYKILKSLKEIKYNGYLSIEDFSCQEDTVAKLKNNFTFINNILNEK